MWWMAFCNSQQQQQPCLRVAFAQMWCTSSKSSAEASWNVSCSVRNPGKAKSKTLTDGPIRTNHNWMWDKLQFASILEFLLCHFPILWNLRYLKEQNQIIHTILPERLSLPAVKKQASYSMGLRLVFAQKLDENFRSQEASGQALRIRNLADVEHQHDIPGRRSKTNLNLKQLLQNNKSSMQ